MKFQLKFKKKNTEQRYQLGNYFLNLPTDHCLPRFQKQFRLYDQFLPILAGFIPEGNVIDIGANVGDTVFALIQTCQNHIICIEPSDFFFSFLEKNIAQLPEVDQKRVMLIKAMIGTGRLSGLLEHSNHGTASLKLDNSIQATHIRLDSLSIKLNSVVLLKTDTDGFDFDVIRSAEKILDQSEPILYWENQVTNDLERDEYNQLYPYLKSKNYNYFYVFDNFGNLLFEGKDVQYLVHLNNYLLSIYKYKHQATFYYVDILISTKKHAKSIEKAVDVYKSDWIRR